MKKFVRSLFQKNDAQREGPTKNIQSLSDLGDIKCRHGVLIPIQSSK